MVVKVCRPPLLQLAREEDAFREMGESEKQPASLQGRGARALSFSVVR